MKKVLFLCSMFFATSISFAQVFSVPGSGSNWSMGSSWVGGVPPTSSQSVVIVANSTIILDVPVNQNADITINAGGTLMSFVPTNSLTINNANLNNSGSVSFQGVDATINNGHYIGGVNALVFVNNFSVSYSATVGNSVNNGDFMAGNNFTLSGNELFVNNVYFGVGSQSIISSGCSFQNNLSYNSALINNYGTITNTGGLSISDSLVNDSTGIITSNGTAFSITNNFHNMGMLTFSDSINIGNDFLNAGTSTNNAGAMNIQNDFYNEGTVTGSSNGDYYIANNSENDVTGVINGVINVCDATLTIPDYLDVDNGTVDFVNVTFCNVNINSVDENTISNQLNVYPNPTNGILNISMKKAEQIQLLDIIGNEIKSINVNSSNLTLDLSDLNNGVYIIKATSSNEEVIQKIILNR